MKTEDIFKMAREAGFSGYDSQSECLTHFFRLAYEAGAAAERNRMIADGWRQCAQGQRTTQHCGMVEQARLEEREKLASAIDHQRRAMKDHFEVQWLRELAAALRARHPEPDDANPSF
jgi:hypothetical protein